MLLLHKVLQDFKEEEEEEEEAHTLKHEFCCVDQLSSNPPCGATLRSSSCSSCSCSSSSLQPVYAARGAPVSVSRRMIDVFIGDGMQPDDDNCNKKTDQAAELLNYQSIICINVGGGGGACKSQSPL